MGESAPQPSFKGWKTISLIFGLLVCIFFVWFGLLVRRNYQAIREGKINPLLEQRLNASISQMQANQQVTAQDLQKLALKGAPSLGTPGAKLTIVEFLDFGCPYCRSSSGPIRELMTKYKDQVFFVVRDFPIEELHPRAIASALAARCVHAQGKFWAYHDRLFADQDHHEEQDLLKNAQAVGADLKTFQTCLQDPATQAAVEEDIRAGLLAGVGGTPTFFFNGVRIQGALDASTLEFLIQKFLK